MNITDYEKMTEATCSPAYHPNKVDLHRLIETLRVVIVLGDDLDQIKKALYYGRGETQPMSVEIMPPADKININIVHAIIGILTEAAELGEILMNYLEDGHFDHEHAVEEIGDEMWYLALALRSLGTNFETAGAKNIAKLMTRYPEKFDAFFAENRNTDAEKEAMRAAS